MSKALDIIKAVREGSTPLPSTTVYRMTNAYSNINCGLISASGDLLLTGCEDSSLILWDLLPKGSSATPCTPGRTPTPSTSNGQQNRDPGGGGSAGSKPEDFDPSVIRLGCDDVSTEKLQKRSILRGHSGPIYDLAFTSQGRYLMSVSEDTTMRLWDLKSGVNKAIYQGHAYPIWSVDTDRVGLSLITGNLWRGM